MKKEIITGTRITFTATTEKYSILEKNGTGFIFKPIKFEKNLPTVPRTFEEMKNEFLAGDIDIEGFEHNEADNKLVELILEGYAKDSLIADLTVIKEAKIELDKKYTEQNELLLQCDTAIKAHEETILSHESTISDQQAHIQEQKDAMQGLKDELQESKSQISNLKSQISSLTAEKEAWLKQEQEYKQAIDGLEASIPEPQQ